MEVLPAYPLGSTQGAVPLISREVTTVGPGLHLASIPCDVVHDQHTLYSCGQAD